MYRPGHKAGLATTLRTSTKMPSSMVYSIWLGIVRYKLFETSPPIFSEEDDC